MSPVRAASSAAAPPLAWRAPWAPTVAAGFCLLVGILDLLAAVTVSLWPPLELVSDYLPGAVTDASSAVLVVLGVWFLLLAGALRRRKRRAWAVALVLLVSSTVVHLVEGPNWSLALVSLLLAVGLAALSREFSAQADPHTRWRALGSFLGWGLVALVTGTVLSYVLRLDQARSLGFFGTLGWTAAGLVGVPGPLDAADGAAADTLYYTLLGLGLFVAAVTAFHLLRSPRPLPLLSPPDEDAMRALLDVSGERDSLAYFALRRDKSVVWSRSHKACVAYRVTSGVMLASGDPLGDVEAWPGAIEAFLAQARTYAWVPAVVGCSETGAAVWCREAGLDALEIGDEAVLETAGFRLEGREQRNVRQMVQRVRRAGYTTEVRRVRDIPAAELELLRARADSWRVGATERGFSMALGRVGDPADGDCIIATASHEGEVEAVLSYVPWGPRGLSLDLMRRARDAAPGVSELLIVDTVLAGPDLGVERVSLNFAVFRSALERGERIGAGPVTRAWRRLLLFASRWTQIESLYRFNAKFRPQWQPRFMLFPRMLGLPRVAVAYLEAEAFIAWPRLGFWRLRERRAASAARPA